MNTFNKKSLYAAMAGLSALGVTGAAQAVSVNPDGLGQVLIYPYYTVRDQVPGASFNSLLSVVNSTLSAKAVKVRFLEGKNSREVLDFNLYLSAKDVWTVAIIPTTGGAGIFTADKSCTQPTVSSSASAPTEFVNYAYTGSAADGADSSLDRTREGYVEIIEMSNLTGTTAAAVTHGSSGVPACSETVAGASADSVPGNGGLFGGISMINVLSGQDDTADAVALDGFSTTVLFNGGSSTLPTLQQVNPPTSVVTSGLSTYITDWSATTNQADAVSAVLMHNHVYNEFVLDASTHSGTDWVLTMPTKRFYFTGGGSVLKLFQRSFGSGGSCDDVALIQYNREEKGVITQTTFSPPPPTFTDSICWEANVITFNNSNVFNSKNVANVVTTFANGWLDLSFLPPSSANAYHALVATGGNGTTVVTLNPTTGAVTNTSFASATYNGLPTIGFAAQTFVNGTLAVPSPTSSVSSLVQSNYSGTFSHRFTRSISTQ